MDTSLEEIEKYNKSLISSPKRNVYRNKIFNDLETSNYDVIQDACQYKLDNENGKTIEQLEEEIRNIYSSRRYRIANKMGDILGKLRFGRKK